MTESALVARAVEDPAPGAWLPLLILLWAADATVDDTADWSRYLGGAVQRIARRNFSRSPRSENFAGVGPALR
jgi:hypothetical protein